MKKALYGTTALFAAGALMASPAAAEEKIKLGVGGYWQTVISYTEQDEPDNLNDDEVDFNPDAVRNEGEIHFTGETTLDNGITFGVNIQLEGVTQGDQIDEHYLIVQGSFGRVLVGAENSAPYLMGYIAPSVALGVNSPNFFLFENYAANSSLVGWEGQGVDTDGDGVADGAIGGDTADLLSLGAGTSTVVDWRTGDANKLTYFTPRFSGFQLGLSYTPNLDDTGGNRQSSGLSRDDVPGEYENGIAVGANYVQTFGGFDVAVSAGFAYAKSEEDDVQDIFGITGLEGEVYDDYEAYGFGVNLGYAGFTLGGSFMHTNNGLDDDGDTDAWDVGLSYETGPWGVSITYLYSETEILLEDDENENSHFELGLSYALGPGITAVASAQYRDEENEVLDDTDGFAFAVGTKLSF